jgi:hypothetical protein
MLFVMPVFVLPFIDQFVIVLLALVVMLLIWVIYSEIRLRKFMRGKSAESLETIIETIQKDNEQMRSFKKELEAALKNFHNRIETSARGIYTVRFNAFGGRGESGAQSFATAIIDEKGDGVVISSIHSRESTRVYAKPLVKLESNHELSDEEKKAIKEADKRAKK